MTNSRTQMKKKRGRPPLSAAKKMRRSQESKQARSLHRALRAKIALLKVDFKAKLKIAAQQAYQRALEKVVKLEHKKMEANYRALALAKAKFRKKIVGAPSQRMIAKKRPGRPSQLHTVQGTGIRKRGRPRKLK